MRKNLILLADSVVFCSLAFELVLRIIAPESPVPSENSENPLWGAPRIHGELLKLRIDVGQATVSSYTPRTRKRQCLDHVVLLNEQHLRCVLREDLDYYSRSRTHLGLAKDCPEPREIEPPGIGETIIALPMVGGLHHRYTRRAA